IGRFLINSFRLIFSSMWRLATFAVSAVSNSSTCCCVRRGDQLFCNSKSKGSCPEAWEPGENVLPPGELSSCKFDGLLGPKAQRCEGQTAACSCSSTVDVNTRNGLVKGTLLESGSQERLVAGFFNLPFALYEGRWNFAKPLKDVSGEEASDHCSLPFLHQLRTDSEHGLCFQWLPGLRRFGRESCLTLDIYSPAIVKGQQGASAFRVAKAKLPVMVFIFGGGFLVGDKYQQGIYDGRKLARSQNVIIVSINYRLGVLGFLHHPDLRDKDGQALMNFGLRDQLEGLKWVHQNIQNFGGDPDRITLVGESAGAMSICAHMASPEARRLFDGVILESTNCDGLFIWQPQKYAEEWGTRYIRSVFGRIRGCNTLLGSDLEHFQDTENACSSQDTATLEEVADQCQDIFRGSTTLGPDAIAQLLPLEWTGGCDGEYGHCHDPQLPSGTPLDLALLRCAARLDVGKVWVNQFGITHRRPLSHATLLEKLAGLEFTGMPLPPHLPWAPVVQPHGPVDLHYASGSGLMTLPSRVLAQVTPRISIAAGFNRDEGTLFSLLVPHFLGDVDRNGDLAEPQWRGIVQQLACPNYGAACNISGCTYVAECQDRVTRVLREYRFEASPSKLRGSCCSKDPNTLRLHRMLTDYLFACPTMRLMDTMGRNSSRRWAYEFEADDELPSWIPDIRGSLGAFHVSELLFVFGNEAGPGGHLPSEGGLLGMGLGFSSQDKVIARKMANGWGAFVRQEEPPEWPDLSSDQVARFVLDIPGNVDFTSQSVIKDTHHCAFWNVMLEEMLSDLK
ncbi:unnamed protein product, partial [Effrenium voratum]